MRFFSDNAAAAHPRVVEAIAASNRLDTAYDGDEWSRRLDGVFSELFETEVRAFWVATGYGLVYRATEVAALGELAKRRGLRFHMDGARFANALVTTGESAADVTWRAGVDALSFGFTKNGGLNAEALILFDASLAEEI